MRVQWRSVGGHAMSVGGHGNWEVSGRLWEVSRRSWEVSGRSWKFSGRSWEVIGRFIMPPLSPKWSEMVLKLSKIVQDKGNLHNTAIHPVNTRPERRRREGRRQKNERSTILPIPIDLSYLTVLFFSLCSNLSI